MSASGLRLIRNCAQWIPKTEIGRVSSGLRGIYALHQYCPESHTYDVVYVDHQDFNKLQNRWNFKYQMEENRSKEKNQLLYVAVSRARHDLFVI